MFGAVQQFVEYFTGLYFFYARAFDPSDVPFFQKGFRKCLGGGDVSVSFYISTSHAEVADFIFVGDPDKFRQIFEFSPGYFVIDV